MSIDERLAVIETKLEARDDRDEERWEYIKMKLTKMPCQDHIESIGKNTGFRKGATRALWIIYAAFAGILFKVFFGG